MPAIDLSLRALRFAILLMLLATSVWLARAYATPVAPPPAPVAPAVAQAARVEVAFVLDSTGSMAGLIDGAKQKIWSIANRLASGTPRPEVRIALIGYRDRGDAYRTRVHDLSDDIDAVYAELQRTVADGGGDTPESVNQALHEAVTRLSWSSGPGVYRVIFLVGDAPPHMDYPDDVPYAQSVALARQRGIVVNTVQCGDLAETTPIWQQIASSGAGQYAAIRQDGGMRVVATPHDDELAQLNGELAATLVPYGAADEIAELEAKRDRAGAAAPATVASRLGFLSKLGGKLNAGRADLVDAIASGATELADVPEESLPASLRALPPAEREPFVAKQRETRQQLQRRIDALVAQRDAHLERESERLAAAGERDGFDERVLDAVREQAAAAGIAY